MPACSASRNLGRRPTKPEQSFYDWLIESAPMENVECASGLNLLDEKTALANGFDLEAQPQLSSASLKGLSSLPIAHELWLIAQDPSWVPPGIARCSATVVMIPQSRRGSRLFTRQLADFFMPGSDVLSAWVDAYNPVNFQLFIFLKTIQEGLGLSTGEPWMLWMFTDLDRPAYRIWGPKDLLKALRALREYAAQDPKQRFMAYFVVELADDHRQEFIPARPLPATVVVEPKANFGAKQSLLRDQAPNLAQKLDETHAPKLPTPPHTSSESSAPSRSNSSFIASADLQGAVDLGLKGSGPPAEPEPPKDEKGPGGDVVIGSLNTDVGQGDILSSDLNAVIPTAQSPSDEEWASCCRLLGLNPASHKDPLQNTVGIPGSEIHVSPRQFWTAFQMLTCRNMRNIAGGVLADVPGTGKTYICIVLCLLRALIFHNVGEVEKSWQQENWERAQGPGRTPKKSPPRASRHLSQDATGDTPCPCRNATGIECYANPGGITRQLALGLVRGPALIQVPSGVIKHWSDVLAAGKLSTTYYHPCMFHTDVPHQLQPPPNLKEALKVTVTPSDNSYPEGYVPKVADGRYTYTVGRKREDKAPERYIFLTTHHNSKIVDEFQTPIYIPSGGSVDGQSQPKMTKKSVYGCPIGVQIVDEFHQVRNGQSLVVSLARSHRHIRGGYQLDFWAVTGTPMPSSFADFETTLGLLYRSDWDKTDHRYHNCSPESLEDLTVSCTQAMAEDGTQENVDELLRKAAAFFASGWVLRSLKDSTFFGKPITHIKPCKPEVFQFFTPAAFLPDVKLLAEVTKAKLDGALVDMAQLTVRSKAVFDKLLLPLQTLSTFPAAAQLVLQGRLDFSTVAIRAEIQKLTDRSDVGQVPLFRELLDDVIRDSRKLGHILDTIAVMRTDKDRRPSSKTPAPSATQPWKKPKDLLLKKMVILCPALGEAVFLYLALRKLCPDSRPVLYHPDLKASERAAVLLDWADLTVKARKRVFIAPFDMAGDGTNLQAANYQILTGPLRFKSDEIQAFHRTNRMGQELPLVHMTLLTEDNPVDRLIVARQARRVIVSDPFDVMAKVELKAQSEAGEDTGAPA